MEAGAELGVSYRVTQTLSVSGTLRNRSQQLLTISVSVVEARSQKFNLIGAITTLKAKMAIFMISSLIT